MPSPRHASAHARAGPSLVQAARPSALVVESASPAAGPVVRAARARLADRLVTATVILACGVVLLRTILLHSFDGAWAPVARALDYTVDPPWRHRVLLVWVANGFRALHPALTPFQAYFASQVVAVFLALGLITRWAGRFVPRREVWAAPALLTLILVQTITYRTFYDFAIVACYAFALELVFQRRLAAYFAVLAAGTLNHEIALFLIPLFVALYFDRAPSRAWLIGWTALQLAVYGTVRLGLLLALPVGSFWQGGKLAYNLGLVAGLKPALLFGVGSLVFWLALAMLAWPRVTPLLRRCVWLLPLIAAEVAVVGQLNEPRQFCAFFPVLVAMLIQGLSAAPVAVEIRRPAPPALELA